MQCTFFSCSINEEIALQKTNHFYFRIGSYFRITLYIEFCASLTVKVLCTDIELSQLVKSFADRFNPQLTEKNACIFYHWGSLDPNYVIFEKSLDYLQIYFSLVQNTLKYTNLCFPIVGCCNCYDFNERKSTQHET